MILLYSNLLMGLLVSILAKNPSFSKQNMMPQTDTFGSEIMANPEIGQVSIPPDLSEEPLPDSVYEEKSTFQKDTKPVLNATLKPDNIELSRSGNSSYNQEEDVKDYPEQKAKETAKLGEETTKSNEINVINENFEATVGTDNSITADAKRNEINDEITLDEQKPINFHKDVKDLRSEEMTVHASSDGTSKKLSIGIFSIFVIKLF